MPFRIGQDARYVRKTGSKAETITGNKTFSGNTVVGGTLNVTGALQAGDVTATGSIDLTAAAVELPVSILKTVTVNLTNAEILALRAAPKTIVPAQGDGKIAVVVGGLLINNYVGAYTESADNLQLKYVDGSGTAASAAIEMTNFADAHADCAINIRPAAETLITAAGALSNALICLHNTGDGEFGGGNAGNSWRCVVQYFVVSTGL